MLDWHSCQICYPLEIKILLLLKSFRSLIIKIVVCKMLTTTTKKKKKKKKKNRSAVRTNGTMR